MKTLDEELEDILSEPVSGYDDIVKTPSEKTIIAIKSLFVERTIKAVESLFCPHHKVAGIIDGGCDTNETLLEALSKVKEMFE